ncbi:DUF4124 domain-containing protein [Comamonas odontotermitis]|uniref:DUF4124 domain-containing protein n=1 Tax=Comamonas odontotermitis TaxID=379895 RepID=UPI001611FDE4|nr:DUF4124 domain-containing protein [Comamonas odontotermitis]
MRKEVCVVAIASVMTVFTSLCYAQKSGSAAVYSCVDATGRNLTADRPIAACADREQRVTMPGGAVRIIGPTYSEREKAEQAAQSRKEAEERYRASDGKRRERALAVRFPNKAAHDAERAEAIEPLMTQIKIVQERKVSLLEDRKKIDAEMEFYKKDPSKAPQSLQSRLKYNREDLKEVDEQVVSINEEVKRTNQRFDEEAQTLKQYWAPAPTSK